MNMLLERSKSSAASWLALAAALFALIAAVGGLVDGSVYNDVIATGNINAFLRVGSLAQDMVTVPLSTLLIVMCVLFYVSRNFKVFIAMIGLVGYLFYGYGLYTIQGQYTSLYLVYLLVFGLSIYGLICGLSSFNSIAVAQTVLPKSTRIAVALFLATIVVVLIPVWLMFLIPTIKSHTPADTYGVFVLDLAVVFPALAVVTIMLIRNQPHGNVFAGVALFKAFTVCLSVAFGEWFVARCNGVRLNVTNLALFGALTTISSVLLVFYWRNLSFQPQDK